MIDAVISADIGTTSLKTGVVSDSGEVVFLSVIPFENPDDRMISEFWFKAFKTSILEFLKTERSKNFNIVAISISGNGPTLVSQNGTVFRWNENLDLNEKEIPQSCKNSLFVPRLIHFKKHFSQIWENSQRIFSGPEFLIYELTGSEFTVLPEIRYKNAYWTDEMLLDCKIPLQKLPPFIKPGKIFGKLKKNLCEELKITQIPVVSSGPDFIAAMIGTNTLSSGKICDCAGSSEGINFCTDKIISSNEIRFLPSFVSGLWNIAALHTESGRRFVECKNDYEKKFNRKITFSEFFSNCLSGKFKNGQKIVDEIALNLVSSMNKLKKILNENKIEFPDEMTVTGGQTKNELWMQERANKLKMNLKVCNCSDSELIGDACTGFFAAGKFLTIERAAQKIVKVKKIYSPKGIDL